MRIAILTFHRAFNCGAMLQAWALKETLGRMGHDAFLPDCNDVGVTRRFREFPRQWWRLKAVLSWLRMEFFAIGTEDLKRFRFARFSRRQLCPVALPAEQLPKVCDAVVVGSDQIWNPSLALGDTGLFLGETLPKAFPKIAYAASVGDNSLREEMWERLRQAVSSFDALSLREPIHSEMLVDRWGRPPMEVVDPTLLLERRDYLRIAEPKRLVKGRYILVYALAVSDFVRQVAGTVGKALGLPVVFVEVYRYGRWGARSNTVLAVSPDRLLAYFRDAEYVLASSFHGTVFSLVFGKRFLSLREREGEVPSRPANLLGQVGELRRLAVCGEDEASFVERLLEPLRPLATQRIAELREVSLAFLMRATQNVTCTGAQRRVP